jgi:hypothetical protein
VVGSFSDALLEVSIWLTGQPGASTRFEQPLRPTQRLREPAAGAK